MAKASPSTAPTNLSAAIAHRDVAAVRRLLAAGKKPSKANAAEAVEQCSKTYARAFPNAVKLRFIKPPSAPEQAKLAAEADEWLAIASALLQAGAEAPQDLCSAAQSGCLGLVELLIKHGADVDYDPPMGTPLENAAKCGHLEVVRALIAAGADIQAEGFMGNLLTQALAADQLAAAKLLIEAGLDVNTKPQFSGPLLLNAVSDQKAAHVTFLLQAGADVNVRGDVRCGDFGEPEVTVEGMFRTTHVPNPPVAHDATPLIVATRLGAGEIAGQLIAAGADLEAVDREGFTALAYAQKAQHAELIRLLTAKGAKVSPYAEGSAAAALMAAARAGDCDRLRALISEGMDVNQKHATDDEKEDTPLTHAAKKGHVEAIKLLVKAGAHVDLKCGPGEERTALMDAARAGQLEAGRALLAAGANAFAKDASGQSVLHHAAEGGNADLIRSLIATGVKVDTKAKGGGAALASAAGAGNAQAVAALLALKADPNLPDREGFTALFLAATNGHADVVKLLLAAGAQPESTAAHLSPLEMASSGGHREVVQLLLQNQPSGKKVKPDGKALINATLARQAAVVDALLVAGADPNATNEDQFTALMAAVRINDVAAVKKLLAAGADVNAINQNRETALDLAHDSLRFARSQLAMLKEMDAEDLSETEREQLQRMAASPAEADVKAVLEAAGGKRGKELKAPPKAEQLRPPAETKVVADLPLPDFRKRAKTAAFKQAIADVTQWCGVKPKPMTDREDDEELIGVMTFKVATAEADKILADHHEELLQRGAYLVKSERGLASRKAVLALLPTTDRAEVFATFQTNGANSDQYPADIVKWFDELAKTQPFLLTGAGFDWCEGRFLSPLKDSKKLAKQMCEFCPDIVAQGIGDVAKLALHLKQTQKFFFWWD